MEFVSIVCERASRKGTSSMDTQIKTSLLKKNYELQIMLKRKILQFITEYGYKKNDLFRKITIHILQETVSH